MEASTFEHLLTTDEMYLVKESRYLAALAARLKVPRGDVEDWVQEAWLSVLQQLAQFTGMDIKRSVHCWLVLVVRGKAVDLMRHRGCCLCKSSAEEEVDFIDEAEARHAETAELEEFLDVLLEKVRSGNEENLLLFCLHCFQGFSIQEIAQHFDMTGCSRFAHSAADAKTARTRGRKSRSRQARGWIDFCASGKK